ncbi:major facilitator superfamily domain-containing protein [Chaetomium strumarium]|uniref:Major facilitator superfamily domain-containing protein n=1 Tax=Chaetomium strumarium TaxID=1170767 RepID=A0AAJ0GMU9_9PEZI|nr:major facilitator superfamily domain-containing protein [Chaetomium strumarium]
MEADTGDGGSKTAWTVEKQDQEVGIIQIDTGNDESALCFNYLSGWRLHTIALGLNLGLFLVNFEITIVSTALVSITNELQEFKRSSWVITAYLITYVAGVVIWAKLSDLFGRKQTCIAALLIFAAFSGGCGAAQSVVQLAVCRAFQGIGGSGIYAVAMVMLYELVPANRYPLYTAAVTVVVALAFSLGPVLGGAITDRASWRWVFLLNVPFAVVAAVILFLATPSDFPYQGQATMSHRHRSRSLGLKLRAIDFPGGFLMLAAMALLITGLEEAASHLYWTGATVLGPLVASALLWVAFLANSWRQGRNEGAVEPVFPWRFCTSRPVVGLLLTSFMTGAVSITCIFQLPLRYQTSAGLDPLQAGVRLIPFSVCGPLGTVVCAALAKGRRVPPIFLAIAGSVMQIIGLVFLARGDPADPDWPGLYGLEVVVGMGFGLCLGAVTLMVPFVVEKRDLAVGAAAPVQLRFLGSATVVSIVTAVGNTWLRNELSGTLSPEQIQAIFRSSDAIRMLPTAELERLVRGRFVESFNLQMHIVLGFAVAGVITALLMWQRNQVRVP